MKVNFDGMADAKERAGTEPSDDTDTDDDKKLRKIYLANVDSDAKLWNDASLPEDETAEETTKFTPDDEELERLRKSTDIDDLYRYKAKTTKFAPDAEEIDAEERAAFVQADLVSDKQSFC